MAARAAHRAVHQIQVRQAIIQFLALLHLMAAASAQVLILAVRRAMAVLVAVLAVVLALFILAERQPLGKATMAEVTAHPLHRIHPVAAAAQAPLVQPVLDRSAAQAAMELLHQLQVHPLHTPVVVAAATVLREVLLVAAVQVAAALAALPLEQMELLIRAAAAAAADTTAVHTARAVLVVPA